jgi:hypothetical protein
MVQPTEVQVRKQEVPKHPPLSIQPSGGRLAFHRAGPSREPKEKIQPATS